MWYELGETIVKFILTAVVLTIFGFGVGFGLTKGIQLALMGG